MQLHQLNSKKQGDVGLGAAISWFTERGYCVGIPLTDSQAYDLFVEVEEGIMRVQVKTSRSQASSGSYIVELRTKGGNKSGESIKIFTDADADLLFVLTGSGQKYIIPSREVSGQSTLTVGTKYERYLV